MDGDAAHGADVHAPRGRLLVAHQKPLALGDAVLEATGAERINYEILGNVEPALHAHVIPRHASEDPELRRKAVWLHDWKLAPPVDADTLDLARQIAARL